MAIDTPARLAILGAGPMGLEAALYARFLGYDVVIYERGDVAASVRQWAHERMDTPFGVNCTTLGIAAIQAQDESYRQPGDDESLTGQEWLDRYLLPLAQTDLLADHLRVNTTVVAVEKEDVLEGDMSVHSSPHAPREDSISRSEMRTMFRVLSRDTAGEERIDTFDGVLDCMGAFENANWPGHGGNSGPNVYILGEKSHDQGSSFRLMDGYEQIRQLFAILGDREALDLYSSARRLIR